MKDNDQKIAEKLKKKKFSKIKTSVKNGIVYLDGEVNSWDEVIELGHAAGEMKEVKGVINNIIVKDVKEKKREKNLPKDTYNPHLPERADVVIIGGGVIGCFIARELSRYNLEIVLLEKESDVACGATKANSGQIHTGVGEESGTLKKKLCAEAWPMYDKITEELDVPFKRNGLLVVITKDTLPKIPSFIGNFISKYIIPYIVMRKGKDVGDKPRIIKRDELLRMEPNITDRALVAVFMPGYGIICPYKLTIALAENAIQNGTKVLLETEVRDILVEDKKVRGVMTNRGTIETQFVINAAGIFADEIAEMAGAKEFTIHPRKGSILLFDKEEEGYVNHQVSELRFPQDPYTKGGGVLMTVDGNINWGPTAIEVPDKEDKSVTHEEIEGIFEKYGFIFPNFPKNSVITYFAGLRAATYKEDFFIKASKNIRGFVNVAGIQSPGLTAAPAIAEMVLKILKDAGLKMEEKENFNPVRKASPVFDKLSVEEKKKLIEKNPLYGNVICRCEHVTEGEIIDAIHSPLPALTIDAIKRRTRAGMGRCQGGFCGPRVAAILARELGIPLEKITKDRNSNMFVGRTKSLLMEEDKCGQT
ncbi:MAG TPA: FAD/NAD(P)-binding oxidoreductase [Methanomicrobia archaeon]|nr:FAD/NAD(P)-binding oxidoreductase [Methanomicrobia archaeon]